MTAAFHLVWSDTLREEPANNIPTGDAEPPGSSSHAPPLTAWDLTESLAVLAIGVVLMHFIYAGPGNGIPGHDSFYHVKMASMIPEYGLLDRFPWLSFTWFVEQGDAFVNHHYGFHLLLLPFVAVAHWLSGDYLVGARWAIATTFGTTMMLFNLLLITARVPWRCIWLFFFLLMPFQFFTRQAFVRAISPSLMLMLLMTLFMLRRHYKLTAVAAFTYIQLYLGGVIYTPLLVGLYTLSSVVGPRGDRRLPTRLVVWTASAWVVGVAVHPYAHGMLEFLKLQVFGSGLSPDIPVGREWEPYEGVWWFTQMSGTTLLVWSIALCLRLRWGSHLSASELFLLLGHFAFLLLTLKARRFVEYWPVFGLLSAAVLLGPLTRRFTATMEHAFGTTWLWGSTCILLIAGVALGYGVTRMRELGPILAEWKAGTFLCMAYMLPPAFRIWLPDTSGTGAPDRRMHVLRTVQVVALGAALLAATACFAGPQLVTVQRGARCQYDLAAVRRAMAYLVGNSKPGDVVFTDDWDVFPVYFYYNSHNHYVVGLDPKFTHARRPDLWERYVRISRGQVPADVSVRAAKPSPMSNKKRIHVSLEDIRNRFHARYVITDNDHRPLASKLAEAKDFAELVYPSTDYDKARNRPYLIFRIRDEAEPSMAELAQPKLHQDMVYLSSLTPLAVEQGWGDFVADLSVGGGAIRLGERSYVRGLGTHTPSKLTYAIPPGCNTFSAVVGIDRSAEGQGSAIVSIVLDGKVIFTSPLLLGTSAPISVRVPLAGAQRMVLEAHPTDDGKQHDHVDWADASFSCQPGGN